MRKIFILIFMLSALTAVFTSEKNAVNDNKSKFFFINQNAAFKLNFQDSTGIGMDKYRRSHSYRPDRSRHYYDHDFTFGKALIYLTVFAVFICSVGIIFPFTIGWSAGAARYPEYSSLKQGSWVLFGFGMFGMLGFLTFDLAIGVFFPVIGAIAGSILSITYSTVFLIALGMYIDSRVNHSWYDGHYKDSLTVTVIAAGAVLGIFMVPAIVFWALGARKMAQKKYEENENVSFNKKEKVIIEPDSMGIRIRFN